MATGNTKYHTEDVLEMLEEINEPMFDGSDDDLDLDLDFDDER